MTIKFGILKDIYMLELDNQDGNKILTEKFDAAFENNAAEEFLKFINNKNRLKPIFNKTSHDNIIQSEIKEDSKNKIFPIQNISIKSNNISITATKMGHIQIHTSSLGNLFIEKNELEKMSSMQDSDKNTIAGGARGFDPFDQKDWPKVIGRKWPTAENTRDPKGVAKLSLSNDKKAILLDTDESITSSYGTKPRAMVITDIENDSVVLAFQQENKNPDIDFAAWSILPFKIKDDKKTIAIFPVDKKTIQNCKDPENDEFKRFRRSDQWEIDANNFLLIEVSKPSAKTEYIDTYTDWCLFLAQGEDTACLVRSCYKDNTENKQFKLFSGQEDRGGTKYFEMEFIAPKVKKGEKSTLVYRIESFSLKKLGFEACDDKFFNSQIKKIGKFIENKIEHIRT